MKNRWRGLGLLFLLLALGLCFRLAEDSPAKPTVAAPPAIKPAPVPASPPQLHRPARLSSRYPHYSRIERQAASSRESIGACFLADTQWKQPRVEVVFLWDGAGKLQSVSAHPLLSDAVENCLERVARKWEVPEHPGMQPFSYSFRMELGG